MKKRIVCATLIVCFLAAAFLGAGLWGASTFEVTHETIVSADLPASFEGLRIACVSDLHGKTFDGKVLSALETEAPDLIFLTGDLADTDADAPRALAFAAACVPVAPTYYVSGNHEMRLREPDAFFGALAKSGVTVLSNEEKILTRGAEQIVLAGLSDVTAFEAPSRAGSYDYQIEKVLASFDYGPEEFVLLLSHRPEYFEAYVEGYADVALCGHTHGGAVRVPGFSAFYAPGQGFFPAYSAGLYQEGNTTMYVSRGLGGGFRIACSPELAILTIKGA